jgi:hypothetical protein
MNQLLLLVLVIFSTAAGAAETCTAVTDNGRTLTLTRDEDRSGRFEVAGDGVLGVYKNMADGERLRTSPEGAHLVLVGGQRFAEVRERTADGAGELRRFQRQGKVLAVTEELAHKYALPRGTKLRFNCEIEVFVESDDADLVEEIPAI